MAETFQGQNAVKNRKKNNARTGTNSNTSSTLLLPNAIQPARNIIPVHQPNDVTVSTGNSDDSQLVHNVDYESHIDRKPVYRSSLNPKRKKLPAKKEPRLKKNDKVTKYPEVKVPKPPEESKTFSSTGYLMELKKGSHGNTPTVNHSNLSGLQLTDQKIEDQKIKDYQYQKSTKLKETNANIQADIDKYAKQIKDLETEVHTLRQNVPKKAPKNNKFSKFRSARNVVGNNNSNTSVSNSNSKPKQNLLSQIKQTSKSTRNVSNKNSNNTGSNKAANPKKKMLAQIQNSKSSKNVTANNNNNSSLKSQGSQNSLFVPPTMGKAKSVVTSNNSNNTGSVQTGGVRNNILSQLRNRNSATNVTANNNNNSSIKSQGSQNSLLVPSTMAKAKSVVNTGNVNSNSTGGPNSNNQLASPSPEEELRNKEFQLLHLKRKIKERQDKLNSNQTSLSNAANIHTTEKEKAEAFFKGDPNQQKYSFQNAVNEQKGKMTDKYKPHHQYGAQTMLGRTEDTHKIEEPNTDSDYPSLLNTDNELYTLSLNDAFMQESLKYKSEFQLLTPMQQEKRDPNDSSKITQESTASQIQKGLPNTNKKWPEHMEDIAANTKDNLLWNKTSGRPTVSTREMGQVMEDNYKLLQPPNPNNPKVQTEAESRRNKGKTGKNVKITVLPKTKSNLDPVQTDPERLQTLVPVQPQPLQNEINALRNDPIQLKQTKKEEPKLELDGQVDFSNITAGYKKKQADRQKMQKLMSLESQSYTPHAMDAPQQQQASTVNQSQNNNSNQGYGKYFTLSYWTGSSQPDQESEQSQTDSSNKKSGGMFSGYFPGVPFV